MTDSPPAALAGPADRWLIALDVDGTVLREDGTLTDAVLDQVRRVAAAGHEVMLATGRSETMTLPIVQRLGITPEYVVCANGALVLRRDASAPTSYSTAHVETFDPAEVLTTIRDALEKASYAVEDATGRYRYSGTFPKGALGEVSEPTDFENLLTVEATRVVVISPEHDVEDFLAVVERMGLHRVSYNVGWTAWLDIAPDGVNKATGLARVQAALGIPSDRVMVVGDGRNDIEMLEWARDGGGVAVAMGQSPDDVASAATEVTGADTEDGVAAVLSRRFPSVAASAPSPLG